MAKKILQERFQELAGIKPLNELETSPTELTDEEKDMVSDALEGIYVRINPTNDIEKYTALSKFVDGWFEVHGGTY